MTEHQSDIDTFLSRSDKWPIDRSGKRIFLIKAVQEIGRSFNVSSLRLPPCLYHYNDIVRNFQSASEDKKLYATSIINTNTIEDPIKIEEFSFYNESTESGDRLISSCITQDRWSEATDIIALSKRVAGISIEAAVSIAAAVFEGVATGEILAYGRQVSPIAYYPLTQDDLNIDDRDAIKARLARGSVTRSNPSALDPRGFEDIFLDRSSLEKWRKRPDGDVVKIELGRLEIVKKAERNGNVLSSSDKRATLLSSTLFQLNLKDYEWDVVWDRLPDIPFKRPGLRIGAERKGKGKIV